MLMLKLPATADCQVCQQTGRPTFYMLAPQRHALDRALPGASIEYHTSNEHTNAQQLRGSIACPSTRLGRDRRAEP
eukprot:scaffold8005_cov118-Isochrysis_galbana.AAC.8